MPLANTIANFHGDLNFIIVLGQLGSGSEDQGLIPTGEWLIKYCRDLSCMPGAW